MEKYCVESSTNILLKCLKSNEVSFESSLPFCIRRGIKVPIIVPYLPGVYRFFQNDDRESDELRGAQRAPAR